MPALAAAAGSSTEVSTQKASSPATGTADVDTHGRPLFKCANEVPRESLNLLNCDFCHDVLHDGDDLRHCLDCSRRGHTARHSNHLLCLVAVIADVPSMQEKEVFKARLTSEAPARATDVTPDEEPRRMLAVQAVYAIASVQGQDWANAALTTRPVTEETLEGVPSPTAGAAPAAGPADAMLALAQLPSLGIAATNAPPPQPASRHK